jgi:uncharacterized protein YbjQ (UPF0145 family)
MLVTTTFNIDGYPVKKYFGIVHGEVILGANFWRDWMAGLTNFLGGRSGAYEKSLAEARENALRELEQEAQKLGANVVLGTQFHYSSIGFGKSAMLMVTATGTAVVV